MAFDTALTRPIRVFGTNIIERHDFLLGTGLSCRLVCRRSGWRRRCCRSGRGCQPGETGRRRAGDRHAGVNVRKGQIELRQIGARSGHARGRRRGGLGCLWLRRLRCLLPRTGGSAFVAIVHPHEISNGHRVVGHLATGRVDHAQHQRKQQQRHHAGSDEGQPDAGQPTNHHCAPELAARATS